MEFEKVRAIVANVLHMSPDSIRKEQNLVTDLGADSLDLYQMVMELETAFEIEVEEQNLPHVHTVGDILMLIKVSK